MYQILLFCILRQFKYVIVYFQCFNLFLCSHGYLFFIWQMYAFPSIYPNKMNFTRLVEAFFSVIVHFFRKLFVSLWSKNGNTEQGHLKRMIYGR